jgi:hypothetical protein
MTPEENKAAAAKIHKLRRELERLEKQSAKHAAARAALDAGTSRARVTTANARWARSAEARDLAAKNLADALEAYAVEQREAVRDALARRMPLFLRDLTEAILDAKLHLVEHARRVRDGSSTTARSSAERVAERALMDLQERGVVRRTTSGWALA